MQGRNILIGVRGDFGVVQFEVVPCDVQVPRAGFVGAGLVVAHENCAFVWPHSRHVLCGSFQIKVCSRVQQHSFFVPLLVVLRSHDVDDSFVPFSVWCDGLVAAVVDRDSFISAGFVDLFAGSTVVVFFSFSLTVDVILST